MLYDYFTKSAFAMGSVATALAGGGAGLGALSSELTGGDWKDNLTNAAGAGIGAGAGALGGGYGIVDPAMESVYSERLRSDLARSIVDDRSKIKKLIDESKTNPNIIEEYINIKRNNLADNVKRIRKYAPGKVFNNKKLRELARVVASKPLLGLGLFAGLGGGLGYATTNAFTGKKEKTAQDIIKDILGKA